jgi:uncharacterized protein YqgC (DUF456 family)
VRATPTVRPVDLTNAEANITILCVLAMILGVVGIVIPMVPGLLLCWLAAAVWAIFAADGWVRWAVLAGATLVAVIGALIKYLWPGRNLKRSGVPTGSLLLGGLLGIVGFFVIPVIGLIIGFVLGVFLGERIRLGDTKAAWPSTKNALRAAGLAMMVELAAALGVAFVFVLGLTFA